jgi:hypothetical protein
MWDETVVKVRSENQYETAAKLVHTSNEEKISKLWNKKCITTGQSLIINRIK